MQISSDGKHLVDGIAFGRSYVGRPIVRPPVHIPPRKRRRLTYEGDEGDALPLFAPQDSTGLFITETGAGGSDDQSDASYDPRNGDVVMENGGDSPELEAVEDDDSETARAEAAKEMEGLSPPMILGYRDDNYLGLLRGRADSDRLPSPGPPTPPLQRPGRKSRVKSIMPRQPSTQGSRRSSFRSSEAGGKAVRFEEQTLTPGKDDPSVASNSESDDADFVAEDEEDQASLPDEDNENASTSSDASSSSSSETSSSSSDESEAPAGRPAVESAKPTTKPGPLKDAKEPEQTQKSDRPTVPPGKGLVGTKKRNERRRRHNILERKKREGILPSKATWDDYEKLQRGEPLQDVHKENWSVKDRNNRVENEKTEMEAKRQELLAAITSGGVDVTTEKQQMSKEERPKTTPRTEPARENGLPLQIVGVEVDPASISVEEEPAQQPSDESGSRRRLRLDVASSKRMLFSSLGLGRSQLTKLKHGSGLTDNNKDTANDMDRTKLVDEPPHTMDINKAALAEKDPQQAEALVEVDDSWKAKIILDAVECCEDRVTLSTPPFPFVQRWDPQQQFSGRKGNRGNKKRKRSQPQYYEEDEHYVENRDDWNGFDEIDEYAHGEEALGDAAEQTSKSQDHGTVNGTHSGNEITTIREPAAEPSALGGEEDDIPAMPADANTCQPLDPKHLVPGAIIGFKQLVIANNWQPEMTAYRTARVEKVLDENTIELTLAKRDRQQKEKIYDENGQRVYGGFEAPGDDEDEEVDDGSLQLAVSELIEPKLVQAGPAPLPDSDKPTGVESEVQHEGYQRSSEESPLQRSAIDQVTDRDENGVGRTEGPSVAGEEIAIQDYREDITGLNSRSDAINSHQDYPKVLGQSVVHTRDLGSEAMVLDTPGSPAFFGLGLEPRMPMHDTSSELLIQPLDSHDVHSPDLFRPDDDANDDPLLASRPDSSGLPTLTENHTSQSPRGVSALFPDPVPVNGTKTSVEVPGHVQADQQSTVLNITHSSIRKIPHLNSPDPPSAQDRKKSSSPRKHATDEDCSSECGLPSLDVVFSSFRPSLASIKDEQRSSQVASQKTENGPSKVVQSDSNRVIASKKVENGTSSKLLVTSTQKSNDFVDLTQLSDGLFLPVEVEDDDDGVNELPSGPGWVEKVKPGRGRGKARGRSRGGSTGRGRGRGGRGKSTL